MKKLRISQLKNKNQSKVLILFKKMEILSYQPQ